MINKRLKGISLFASAGIGETYFKDAGIDIMVSNELLERRAELYKAISPETIVLKIDDPTNSPEHVTICFKTETGELTHGIITDIRILYLFEKIRQVLKFVVV